MCRLFILFFFTWLCTFFTQLFLGFRVEKVETFLLPDSNLIWAREKLNLFHFDPSFL